MTEAGAHALDVLASPVRRQILDLLANLPVLAEAGHPHRASGLTATELSGLMDLHVTTVRFHVDRLIRAGLVEAHDRRSGVGRPRRHYTAAPGILTDVIAPDAFRLLSEVLADAMATGDAPTAHEAGRRWALKHAIDLIGDVPASPVARTPGTWLAKVGGLIDVLARWGYDPSVSTADSGRTAEIRLHHCPLAELARENPAVACGVHRGVIAGTMEALGEADASISLVPFITPTHCIASVTTSVTFPQPPSGKAHT